jgi:hypothetical protein
MTAPKLCTIAAAIAALLAAGTVHAASPITLKCISSQAQTLKNTIVKARADFRTNKAACFGPGQQCAIDCQTQNDANCNNPSCISTASCGAVAIGNETTACDNTCAATQKTAIDACRSDFVNNLITQDQLDMCANAARLANANCKIGCTGQFAASRLACSQAYNACLASCASCNSTSPCP